MAKTSWTTLYRKGRKYINYRMGLAGAVVMAVIVFIINYCKTHEVLGSSTASIKQGVYTLVFGGLIMGSCENLAVRIRRRATALLLAVVIPSLTAITLTFLVHSLRGTPHPVESTIPTAVLVIPATAIWGRKKRITACNQLENHTISDSEGE